MNEIKDYAIICLQCDGEKDEEIKIPLNVFEGIMIMARKEGKTFEKKVEEILMNMDNINE